MFKIEKKVEMPAITRNVGSKYPFADMEVGDSFLVPLEYDEDGSPVEDTATLRKRMNGACSNAVRRYKDEDRKFTARNVEGGVRVWRTQ